MSKAKKPREYIDAQSFFISFYFEFLQFPFDIIFARFKILIFLSYRKIYSPIETECDSSIHKIINHSDIVPKIDC